MNENSKLLKISVLMFSVAMLFSAFGAMPVGEVGFESEGLALEEVSEMPQMRGTRGSSNRTVLAELVTNWGCPGCPTANAPLNELLDVYGPEKLVMVAYHTPGPEAGDPFYDFNPVDNTARYSTYYGVTGIPTVFFDGPPEQYPPGDKSATYSAWKTLVSNELMVLSPLTITLDGYLGATEGRVNVTIHVTDPLPTGSGASNNLRFMVVEDNLYAPGVNGESRHRYGLRDMLADEVLPFMAPGTDYTCNRTFPIDMMYNRDSLSIVVFVQHDHTGETDDKDVLQAAMFDFIPQKILVVDDDQSTNPDGDEDFYQITLSLGMHAFDGWVLDEVGSPTSDDLSSYDVVIWVTGSTTSSTLTTADQTAISTYLDNTGGNLFMCGENIGEEIGSSTFYQNYLHANFINDNTGMRFIRGITGDPISDMFSSDNMPIYDTSPNEITPRAPATQTFTYETVSITSAIKAEHDMDSRMVFFAFKYFEYNDEDWDKRNVMDKVLNWLSMEPQIITLSQGYNLISIPALQFDTSLDSVFDTISGKYDALQAFNAMDTTDHWKHHHESKPPEMNDLSYVDHTMGVWIRVTEPGQTNFAYNGTPPTMNQEIELRPGWNLVGYPSLSDKDRDTALNNLDFDTHVDSIFTYDAATQQWKEIGEFDNFEVGQGYWIRSNDLYYWTVPL
ncbi:MAG: Omp28-related outer membrane protein [Methanomassiliicoccales archaeon]|nr:MAG: Omp28-related outer membrane protein [Methanomassiliicoccales archaeon]